MRMAVNLILISFIIYIMQVKTNHLNTDISNNLRFQQMLRSFLNEKNSDRTFKLVDTHESTKSRDHKIFIDGKETPYEAYKCVQDCQTDSYPVTCVQRCPY